MKNVQLIKENISKWPKVKKIGQKVTAEQKDRRSDKWIRIILPKG